MKVLLAKRRALGDTVLLSSTVEALAAARPDAEISVLVPRAFAPVLVGNPRIRDIFTFEMGAFSLVRELRSRRFDHVFQLHASPRLRYLSYVDGARHHHFHQQNRETEKAYGKHPHALEWDSFCLRGVFGEAVPLPAPPPRIYLSDVEKEEGRAYWRRQGVDPTRVIFLGLGASRPTKRWPPAHFARFAELLRDREELVPAIITGPGEEEERFAGLVIDELRVRGFRPSGGKPGSGSFVHGAGLGVRQLAGALGAVAAYVGNDSGPKHIAVAVGTPTLTLFGPEDPQEWHPYDREAHPLLFLEGLRCRNEDGGRWCGIPVCVTEGHRCMQGLDPLETFGVLKALLTKKRDISSQ